MILLASAIAVRHNAHMGFDLLIIKLPKSWQRWVGVLNHVLVLGFLVSFLFLSVSLVDVAGGTMSPALGIPMGLVYLVLPVSAILMLVYTGLSIRDLIVDGHQRQAVDREES